MQDKDELRKLLKDKRNELSAPDAVWLSKKICDGCKEFLLSGSVRGDIESVGSVTSEISSAGTVPVGAALLYSSIQNEVDLTELFLACKENIPCFYPHTNGKDMYFHRIADISELTEGSYGIKEPGASAPKYDSHDALAVCFVPGVAFDKRGNRIGYGAGYYDRFLSTHTELIRVGICYDFQMLDEIPSNEHDIKMQYIITEKGVFKTYEA